MSFEGDLKDLTDDAEFDTVGLEELIKDSGYDEVDMIEATDDEKLDAVYTEATTNSSDSGSSDFDEFTDDSDSEIEIEPSSEQYMLRIKEIWFRVLRLLSLNS